MKDLQYNVSCFVRLCYSRCEMKSDHNHHRTSTMSEPSSNSTGPVTRPLQARVWNDRSISLSSQIRLMRSLVTAIFLYACESWTVTAELQRRIQAMEMRCHRKILCNSCKDHVTNEEVRAKTQQAIGPHEDRLS